MTYQSVLDFQVILRTCHTWFHLLFFLFPFVNAAQHKTFIKGYNLQPGYIFLLGSLRSTKRSFVEADSERCNLE